jgi:hypothetical protein
LVEKNGGRPIFRDHAESMKYLFSEQKAINELVQELGLDTK